MKKIQTAAYSIVLLILIGSCQSGSTHTSLLSDTQSRNEIMEAIAADSTMSNEMIGTLLNNENGMMTMQNHQKMTMGNHSSMMNMVKNNPDLTHNMMSTMVETAKSDSSMMSGMIRTMMADPQMMQMMQNRICNGSMNGMK
ncbi:hypothetical protein [Algoriphagus antarcticus]|jgi:hypothetical protein|uniref:Membrane or secreted protein n=1 Tax=Algoriphagus antarcticus TaxID=238540 RepID=A0A3E0DBK7_9BACT|nr:hypothetical protein [Algoriphagus antarcticus]REG79475.1 hypothetical protein C8N25_13123 [Algoriphagus antarcticus]